MMAARTPSPLGSPPVSPLSPRGMPRYEVLFESYLQKTPPLEKLFVSWRKRYFVLSRTDPLDPSTLELVYYMDNTKREKRGVVNLAKFVGLSPNAKVGNKDHAFALETEDRKYILRAPDAVTKNIWLAKLCEVCGQEQVFHITLPQHLPVAEREAILKLSDRDQVVVISPSSGSKLLEIPYRNVRRMGNMDVYSSDLIWFETCSKGHNPDEFHFFIVPSGFQTTHHILRELKTATECATGVLLITEETNGLEMSFISRNHYGCHEFPSTQRNKALQNGLRLFTHSPSAALLDDRRASEPPRLQRNGENAPCLSLEDFALNKQRRQTSNCIHPLMNSRRRPGVTLDQFRSNSSFSSTSHLSGSGSGELSDSGGMSDVFEGGSGSSIPSQLGSSSSSEQTPARSSDYSDPPQVPPRSRISLQHDRESFTLEN